MLPDLHGNVAAVWSQATPVPTLSAIRERYPRWGKAKLRILLGRNGSTCRSRWSDGSWPTWPARGVLRVPARRRVSVRQRRWPRPHAVRLPRGLAIERPGDLVELDTLDIRPSGVDHPFKQFTARDRGQRWDTLVLGRQATARAAATCSMP